MTSRSVIPYPPERPATLVDVLDRVLDKGIVIDSWERYALGGIELMTVKGHAVVASIDTYLQRAEAIGEATGLAAPVAPPPVAAAPREELGPGPAPEAAASEQRAPPRAVPSPDQGL